MSASLPSKVSPPFGDYEANLPAVVKTMLYENTHKLPHLHVPPLEDTMANYLASVKAICDTPADYEAQVRLVEEFKSNGIGGTLHAIVETMDHAHHGYPYTFIEEIWDDVYYKARCPAPVNFSPFMAIADDKDATKMVQVVHVDDIWGGHCIHFEVVNI